MINGRDKYIKGYFILGLPVTLPLSLASAPIFFLTRQAKIAG